MRSNRFITYYFSLVLLIGGLAYAPWVLASYGLFPSDLFFVFIIVGGASPTIAALVVARLELGKRGAEYCSVNLVVRAFQSGGCLCRFSSPLALAACTVLLWSITGGVYRLDLMKLAEFPPILIANFLMNLWEEIGGRSYALPALQKKHSALFSSPIVGIFWVL
jgi:membrane protease YdiL (CAAX protease family)